ncbi:MAG: hypothetical protein IKL68_03840 [Clostridia bacterium]|nr:hypothetical protein [Clostridia bacterium]
MQKKRGISLIVLSITILVMAILAATAIIALEDSGIIGRSKNTVNKQNYNEEYTRLQVIKNGILTDNLGEITVDEYITELSNKGLIETGVTTNSDGSKSVTTKTGFVANVMQDGESNLIISLGTSNATIALNPTSISGDITSGPVNKTITVNASNVTGDITWTTSNANVATVTGTNSSATVTLKGIGSATITATYGNAKASCNVTVTGTVTTPTITLNKTTISKTIDSGSTATETITATTANISGSLTWTSSNTSVATVSASGNTATVTMKAGGTSIITAKYGSTSASCTVVVTENVANSGLGSLITAANYGDTVDYTVTVDGTTYNNWKIYYHNSEYVYLISTDVADEINLDKGTTVASLSNKTVSTLPAGNNTLLDLYNIFRVGNFDKFVLKDTIGSETAYNCQGVAQLITDYTDFANTTDYGNNVIGAIGGPTIELLVAAWNSKKYSPTLYLTLTENGYMVNDDTGTSLEVTSDGFYVTTDNMYWLASPSADSIGPVGITIVGYGRILDTYFSDGPCCVTPVVCLKASTPAKVGTGSYDFELTN